MDPNQAPITPPTPTEPTTPQPETPAPVTDVSTPVTPPEVSTNPVVPVPIVPNVPPASPVGDTPVAPFGPPVPQPVASSDVFGSAPQPVASVVAAVPASSGSGKKIFVIIAAIVVGLGVLGTAAWLLIGILTGGSITLKEYSGDKFSILVPENYEQDISSSSATFTEPNSTSADEESRILVQRAGSVIGDRDKYIEIIDSSLTDDKLNAGIDSGASIANMKIAKSTKGNQDIRTVTADIKKDDALVGTIRYLFIIGEDDVYIVVVASHISDSALATKAQEITDSFKLK